MAVMGNQSVALLGTDAVTSTHIAADSVGESELADGAVVQVVNVQDGEVNTGTTLFVLDDTIPQNTEGDEYMTLAITPKSTTNKLKIEVICILAHSTSTDTLFAALFQDSTANALAISVGGRDAAASSRSCITFTHYMTAGTTSSTTFKVHGGAVTAGTTTFNGSSAAREFGGVLSSSITITEIEAS